MLFDKLEPGQQKGLYFCVRTPLPRDFACQEKVLVKGGDIFAEHLLFAREVPVKAAAAYTGHLDDLADGNLLKRLPFHKLKQRQSQRLSDSFVERQCVFHATNQPLLSQFWWDAFTFADI